MKKHLKQAISFAMASTMAMSCAVPTLAEEENSSNPKTNDTQETVVSYDAAESEWTWTVPATQTFTKDALTTSGILSIMPVDDTMVMPENTVISISIDKTEGNFNLVSQTNAQSKIPYAVSKSSSLDPVRTKETLLQFVSGASSNTGVSDTLYFGTTDDNIKNAAVSGMYQDEITFVLKITKIMNSYIEGDDVIPTGAIYNRNGIEHIGDGTVKFPSEPQTGDIYVEGDYVYAYNVGNMENFNTDIGSDWEAVSLATINVIILSGDTAVFHEYGYDDFVKYGTGVEQKSFYDNPRSSVAGKPVTSFAFTYYGLDQMTTAPTIPDTAVNMTRTFCECRALASAPTIPANVEDMSYTFYNDSALSGTLVCNANPSNVNMALYNTNISDISGSCNSSTKSSLISSKI